MELDVIAPGIIETANANRPRPYDHLAYLLEQLPNLDNTEPIPFHALMPCP